MHLLDDEQHVGQQDEAQRHADRTDGRSISRSIAQPLQNSSKNGRFSAFFRSFPTLFYGFLRRFYCKIYYKKSEMPVKETEHTTSDCTSLSII